jgi:2-keto-4-pentenoate hydratase/2-oxohepta-3-ene-1,7-dioic acid hydratase in catechol pathway
LRLFRYRDAAGAIQIGATKHRAEQTVFKIGSHTAAGGQALAKNHWLSSEVWVQLDDFPGTATDEVLEDLDLLAPVDAPSNILCVGLNYQEHSDEFLGGKQDALKDPIIFSKSPSCIIGPGVDVDLHDRQTQEVDYEAEVAVIIGREGRDIATADAWEYVFGLTALNDVTARDVQRRHQQWTLGKSLDTFCPMGPWIVTLDEFELPLELDVRGLVDGQQRQNSNTRHLIFDIPTLISVISRGRTLEVGDVLATGTPSGVGMAMDPPGFLRPGQSVAVEVEGIGTLQNVCVGSA